MGVKFGTVPNFAPIGATYRPCRAKNLKIDLNTGAHNAAGKKPVDLYSALHNMILIF